MPYDSSRFPELFRLSKQLSSNGKLDISSEFYQYFCNKYEEIAINYEQTVIFKKIFTNYKRCRKEEKKSKT